MSARRVQTPHKAEKIEATEKVEKVIKAPKTAKAGKAEEVPVEVIEKVTKKKAPEVVPAEEEPAAPPVEEHVDATKEEETIEGRFGRIKEIAGNAQRLLILLNNEVKRLEKEVQNERKKAQKIITKTNNSKKKERTGVNGLDKMIPVQTPEFRSFVEKNYQQLTDSKDGNQILPTLTYDENDGSLMLSRKLALRLITAYVKKHQLQQYPEDMKRIKMDKTLEKLFPEFVGKDKDGNEKKFFFCSIMGGYSRHFASVAKADA